VPGSWLPNWFAGEAEHDEAVVLELLVEGLEAFVLGRQAALAGRVDDEDDLAGVVGEVAHLSREGRGTEVGESGHEVIVTRGTDAHAVVTPPVGARFDTLRGEIR
jgi:hypothetical protein